MCDSVDGDLAGVGLDLVQDAVVATMRTVKSLEIAPKWFSHPGWIVGERSEQKLDDSRYHPRWKTIQRADGSGTQLDRARCHLAEPTP
jgi:hypothetical protein